MKAPVVVLSEMSFSASSFKGKMSFRDGEVEDSISVAASAVVSSALIGSPSLYKRLICGFVQGVPTSLGYAKCNFLSEFYKISILEPLSIFCICSGKTIYKIHHATRRR